MGKVLDTLSEELVGYLQGERIVSLITIDVESKKPTLDAISWLVAHPGGKTLSFAVGHKATSARNIQHEPYIILGVVGAGSCFSIKGTAVVSDVVEKTMKLRIVTVEVEAVEDVMFYGGKVSVEPEYVKTYNAELAAKLDEEVYGLLRNS
ncbi:pyridoxamine 5'-phosphate oxidase [Aneurinibacillus danicus]|jgi:hypothetical protein|uniref:Pyridoxamine 5'-phosphate oxidase putative domain-containing protein n=1 Tax=Aneurinibacillus danicus TaxID=267746 RepID=A0A511V9M4_9BACL|nr:pyridoxamine 5'-phosphate oxidase [Aneurinibacillus danicus]GEN33942.1 hypothetical protein ADA01nite_14020 [Aneurinibacillus danicus]